jgi:hypothetical protein
MTVDTCRLDRDGRPGDRFRVTIAGPGNLFRVRNLGPGDAAGTTVRLRLSSEAGKAAVSCVDMLRRILWIAEFETGAVEGVARAYWPPGELGDSAPVGESNPMTGQVRRLTSRLVPAGDGVWWADGVGAVLADGLWVGRSVFGVVVNLTGPLAPELSVDRNEIRRNEIRALSDEAAVDILLSARVPALLGEGAFEVTRAWLDELTYDFPLVADAVVRALAEAGHGVWVRADGLAPPVERIGCFPLDSEVLPAAPHPRLRARTIYAMVPDPVVYRRMAAWAAGAVPAESEDAARPDTGAAALSLPSDVVLVGWDASPIGGTLRYTVGEAVFLAGRLRRPLAEVHRRLRNIGLAVDSGKFATVDEITRDDLVLVTPELDGQSRMQLSELPVGHVALAAQNLGLDPGVAGDRFRSLGFTICPRGVAMPTIQPLDLVVLSADLTGRALWLSRGRVGLAHLLRAALHTGLSVETVRSRLLAFGFRAAPSPRGVDLRAEDGDLFNADDRNALDARPVPLGFVLKAAGRTGRPARAVADRLGALGFAVARTSRLPAGPTPDEPVLFEDERYSPFRSVGEPVSRLSLVHAAGEASRLLADLAGSLRERGFSVAAVGGAAEGRLHELAAAAPAWSGGVVWRGRIGVLDVLALAADLGMPTAYAVHLLDALGLAAPEMSDIESTSDDAVLFDMNLTGGTPSRMWRDGRTAVPVAHVLAAGIRLRRDAPELADRARFLGCVVADPAGWDASPLATGDVALLARDIDLDWPWLPDGPVPTAHLLAAAAVTGQPPAQVARRLGDLGFATGPVVRTTLTAEQDRVLADLLHSADPIGGQLPWASPGRASLLAAAQLAGRAPRDLARWLGELGAAPARSAGGWTAGDSDLDLDVSADDLDLLSRDVDGEGPWLADGPVPYGHVLAVAGHTGRSPRDLAERLRRLGFDVTTDGSSAGAGALPEVETVDAVDLVLLSRYLDGNAPRLWGGGRLPAARLLHAACVLGCDVAEVRERYVRLGFDVPPGIREIDRDERTVVTVAFHRADTTALGREPVPLPTVLGVAEFVRRRPEKVADTLAGLGLSVDHDRVAEVCGRVGSLLETVLTGLTARDALLLSARLDGRGPWLGHGLVSPAHVLAAAGYLRWSPGRVAARLTLLGCDVQTLADGAHEAFIDGVDRALVEILRDGRDGPYADRPFSRAEILVASWRYRWSPRRIVDRLGELGFAVPDRNTFDR